MRTMAGGLIYCVDGGGTKSRARLVDAAGTSLAESEGGPCNPSTGFDRAVATFNTRLWRQCAAAAGLRRRGIGRHRAVDRRSRFLRPGGAQQVLGGHPAVRQNRGFERRLCGADRSRQRQAVRSDQHRHRCCRPPAVAQRRVRATRRLGLARRRPRQRCLARQKGAASYSLSDRRHSSAGRPAASACWRAQAAACGSPRCSRA